MKSILLIIFIIFVIFAITSKANIESQVNERMPIDGGGYKTWLNEVSGYDQNDSANGYAGIIGEPITSLRVSGGQKYIVHILDEEWLGEMTKNDQNDAYFGYAGTVNGKSIDAVAIDGGVEYSVHILRGEWLPPITGYNIMDDTLGYAGIFGKPIDAIMIKDRTYAVSFTDNSNNMNTSSFTNTPNTTNVTTDKCTIQGGTCMNPNSCNSGTVLNDLCPGESSSYKCCIPVANKNSNMSNILNTIFIITATLAVVMIIIVIFFCYYHKKSQNSQNSQNSPAVIVVDDKPPPPYTERDEYNANIDLGNIRPSSLNEKNSYHSKVRMFSDYQIHPTETTTTNFSFPYQYRHSTIPEKSKNKSIKYKEEMK